MGAGVVSALSSCVDEALGGRSGSLVTPGVWCQAVAVTGDGSGAAERRDMYAAVDPEAAIEWIRGAVRRTSSCLGRLQRAYVLEHWAHGKGSLEDYDRLRQGRPCALTVYPADHTVTWQAVPRRFVQIIAVNGGPPCPDRRSCLPGKPG
ncbi:hypothetical protein ACLIYP_00905 [Streptomyces nanhaiensis]|uniref:hypothetical protein n=1 Tax=Streptomyces nanhaiensis TaxID=679319 RepID=UPI00399C8257